MKLRNPWLIRLAGLLASWLIRVWMSTVRCRFRFGRERVDPNDPATAGRYLYVFWHETMLFLAGRKPKATIYVLISRHADGELIAQTCRHLGFKVVRGSSTRGGVEAVRQLMRQGRRAHLAVTPDGPRGPRRQVQPGVVYLASRTGLPIVAAGVGYGGAWRARSWDRFAVPKPWSKAVCVVAPAVHVPPNLKKEEIEAFRLAVEERLLAATAAAEKWARE